MHPGTDPVELAKAGQAAWNLPDLYLADLDAILGEAAPNLRLYRTLADLGLNLWVDSGVREPHDVPRLIESGVAQVIVGLETINGPRSLQAILDQARPDRVVFSLDLKNGRPLVDCRTNWGTDRVDEIAAQVIELGIERIIELDLARVGIGRPDDSLGTVRDRRAAWFLGGGITSAAQIETLRRAGFAGVLVGSALHDGRIDRDSLDRINNS